MPRSEALMHTHSGALPLKALIYWPGAFVIQSLRSLRCHGWPAAMRVLLRRFSFAMLPSFVLKRVRKASQALRGFFPYLLHVHATFAALLQQPTWIAEDAVLRQVQRGEV
eukprot:1615398-Amphidinium_carterae.1